MRKWLLCLAVMLPFGVHADFMEVIEVRLKDDCAFADYLQIVQDFNAWARERGYETEIAAPLHSDDVKSLYWMGRTRDAATFGEAWDAWRAALGDPDSEPAKLSARFGECVTNLSRRSYDVY